MRGTAGSGGADSVNRFTDQLFGDLRRIDQRRWAHAYVLGLLTTPGKKSMRRLAAAASDSPTASQALHQFINESPWDWTPVCDRLRHWIEGRVRPRAWTIAPVVLPKRGEKSCGVHRRFVPHTGRTVNCQVGTALFMSTDIGDFPCSWSLLLPEPWARGDLRERARVPDGAVARPESPVLSLVELLVRPSRHEPVPVVVGVDGYLDVRPLLHALIRARRDFVVAVPDGLPLAPFPAARPVRVRPRAAARMLDGPSGRERGARGLVRNQLVQLPFTRDEQRPQPFRLFAGPGTRAGGLGRLWLTNIVDRPVGELMRYADRTAAVGETVNLLERGFGLRDFEGRSFPGWHHHMTLVSAAFAYSRLTTAADGYGALDMPGDWPREDDFDRSLDLLPA
ncbi:transposase [Streptomyces sp. CC210A]|uniref:IS701 family transposase n=1 Tax=Streptomyces sp. CC210A TaxID=2898184 RepID=UPI001F1C5BF9|nr:transposase [Streptomyces sp. CC210A]